MKRLSLLAALTLLTACQTMSYVGDESSPYYMVPVGSRVTLNRDLVIPADKAGVFLQNGQEQPFVQLNAYHPHCKFEVKRVLDTPQTVRADEFVITKMVQSIEHSVQVPQRLAAMTVVANTTDGGPSVEAFVTRLNLRSERQPEVLRLSCGHWDYRGQTTAVHLSIQQIRKALGDVITLQIAPASRP
jgi:hypothetical protein